MKTRTIVILSLLALAAGGIYYYYERQIVAIENLSFKLIGFSIGDLSQPVVQANLTFRITSTSTIDAQVTGLFLNVFVNGAKLGTIQNSSSFIIPAMGYSDVPLVVTFSPAVLASDLLTVLSTYITSQDMLVLIQGYVSVKSAFLSISVPVNYSTTSQQILANT